MNLKSTITKSIVITAMAGLATACGPSKIKSDPAIFALLTSQITGMAAGNCAISINHAGLRYGAIVTTAVTNAGTASGIYSNTALNGNVQTFDQTQYEAATGSTVSTQGYASYAEVPYNLKYDAFFSEGGAWTAARRNAALNWTKTFRDHMLFIGNLAVGDTSGASAAFPTGTGAAIASLLGSDGASSTACNTFSTFVTTCNAAISTLAGSFGVVDRADGTASLACARIPAASCSVSALTTPNRAADITAATAVVNAIADNAACRRPSDRFTRGVREAGFKGLPHGTVVNTNLGIHNAPRASGDFADSGFANSTSSVDRTTRILPERAYPKFGSLVSLGFGGLMPINRTEDRYSVSATAFNFGRNLQARLVTSCESIGLNRGITVDRPEASRQELTSAAEAAYALSNGGTAASVYNFVNTEITGGDSVACNSDFRSKFSIPVALGGGRLPIVQNAPSGDGGATSLLSICVYGGSATSRVYPRQVLASGLNIGTDAAARAQISICGEGSLETVRAAQQSAAELFGEVGTITTGSNFPNTTTTAPN